VTRVSRVRLGDGRPCSKSDDGHGPPADSRASTLNIGDTKPIGTFNGVAYVRTYGVVKGMIGQGEGCGRLRRAGQRSHLHRCREPRCSATRATSGTTRIIISRAPAPRPSNSRPRYGPTLAGHNKTLAGHKKSASLPHVARGTCSGHTRPRSPDTTGGFSCAFTSKPCLPPRQALVLL
jgi:hypothetical protein